MHFLYKLDCLCSKSGPRKQVVALASFYCTFGNCKRWTVNTPQTCCHDLQRHVMDNKQGYSKLMQHCSLWWWNTIRSHDEELSAWNTRMFHPELRVSVFLWYLADYNLRCTWLEHDKKRRLTKRKSFLAPQSMRSAASDFTLWHCCGVRCDLLEVDKHWWAEVASSRWQQDVKVQYQYLSDTLLIP